MGASRRAFGAVAARRRLGHRRRRRPCHGAGVACRCPRLPRAPRADLLCGDQPTRAAAGVGSRVERIRQAPRVHAVPGVAAADRAARRPRRRSLGPGPAPGLQRLSAVRSGIHRQGPHHRHLRFRRLRSIRSRHVRRTEPVAALHSHRGGGHAIRAHRRDHDGSPDGTRHRSRRPDRLRQCPADRVRRRRLSAR